MSIETQFKNDLTKYGFNNLKETDPIFRAGNEMQNFPLEFIPTRIIH